MRYRIPELLAPAGSMDALRAAVSAGADAVYLGGKKFGARNLASNFTPEELKNAVDYCHSRNVRVYVTHNILVHDAEIPDSINELYYLFTAGIDAVLLQDYGAMALASRLLPGLKLHSSTQMTIHNPEGVLWAAENGISRVVLSREMSLKNIKLIKKSPAAENTGLEVFVHGALCCSYSGQCLLSSMIGGRSGNRGLCAQPCRKEYGILSLKYDEDRNVIGKERLDSCYLMSPADLCTYRCLDSVVESGVESIKIEGRMKSPEYVATVVSVYRRALDMIAGGGWSPSEEDETLLMLAFNRGFTGGYISGESGPAVMSTDQPGNRGVFAGDVVRYDSSKSIATVLGRGRVMPQPGDGVLIRQDGRGDDFGLEIPGNAVVQGNEISFHVRNPVSPGSRVFITKSLLVSKLLKEILSRPGGVSGKIPVGLRVFFDGRVPVAAASFPSLHGVLSIEFRAKFSMEEARSRPVDPQDLKNIFCKTGNLQYEVANYESCYEGDLFAPVSMLNEFRRDIFSGIERSMIESCLPSAEETAAAAGRISSYLSSFRLKEEEKACRAPDPSIGVYISGPESADAALRGGCSRLYYEIDIIPCGDAGSYAAELERVVSAARSYGASMVWKWPRITDHSFFKIAEEILSLIGENKPDGIMVENPGDGIAAMRIAKGTPLYGGQGLNIFNHLSVGLFTAEYNLLTLSCELNHSDLKKLCKMAGCSPNRPLLEYMVHGPAEIFVSENNLPESSLKKRYSPGTGYGITDSTGRIFPLRIDGYGRTHIYNSAVTCLIDNLHKVLLTGVDAISLDLGLCHHGSVEKTVDLYNQALASFRLEGRERKDKLDSLREKIMEIYKGEITAGHFFRGV